MIAEHKDFTQLEREIRESFETYLSIQECRRIMGCSWRFVIRLIQDGRLNAVDITGKVVDRRYVDEESHGLRIPPSSLRDFLNKNIIR